LFARDCAAKSTVIELKQISLIDAKAQAADQAPDFSAVIRAGLPGFEQ